MALEGLIDQQAQLPEAIRLLTPCDVLAVDTEFLWERTYYPKLALLQVAGWRGDENIQAFAVDPLTVDLTPLLELLAEPSRLKVLHAARIDLQILNRMLETPLAPVFDTQLAAALGGYGPQVGYASLVQVTHGLKLKKIEQYTDWTKRPLRPAQLEYALDDVIHLLEVYERLEEQLEDAGRLAWAEQEMAHLIQPETYLEGDPAELYTKIKGRRVLDRRGLGVLRELAVWRDGEARKRDLRPTFVVKDPPLVEIAGRRPRALKQLHGIRGLHKNEVKRCGEAILKCVKRGEGLSDQELPSLKRGRRGARAEVSAAVDLMKACLNMRASEVGVAAETLVTSSELERLARDGKREQFSKDHAVLQGWRRELIGEDLLRILRGEVSLGVDPASCALRLREAGTPEPAGDEGASS